MSEEDRKYEDVVSDFIIIITGTELEDPAEDFAKLILERMMGMTSVSINVRDFEALLVKYGESGTHWDEVSVMYIENAIGIIDKDIKDAGKEMNCAKRSNNKYTFMLTDLEEDEDQCL